jgi:hypothetical protein
MKRDSTSLPAGNASPGAEAKPRLVFFQSKYGKDVPEFMGRHKDEHVRCLRQWFDVTIISHDCDYERVCEGVAADMALFETGVNLCDCERLRIRNVRNVNRIPKLALLNADGWCETRAGILSDIDEWGIDTLFSIAVTAAEHTPSIADRLFVWPNFVEPNLFRDYGDPKIVPILITGSQDPQYPWRKRVYGTLVKQFPTLVCPHGGYSTRAATHHMLHGEPYARAISASCFAPACGTVAKEVVRKHFEIPACKTCLITENSPGLRAAGFVDMKNCIFADEHDVADKVGHLLEHRNELEAICVAGSDLIKARHTAVQRDQIYRWYVLHRDLKPGERIVQTGPFDPPVVVSPWSGARSHHVLSNGHHLRLLRDGDAAFVAGDYAAAEKALTECLRYMPMLPEAKFKLALCSLRRGAPRTALRRIIGPIRYTLSSYRAVDPDPVEWAYLIIALLCGGRLREAQRRANQFPELRHPELERARVAVHVLRTGACFEEPLTASSRMSIHTLAKRSADEWVRDICNMLEACNRPVFAKRLEAGRFDSGGLDSRGPGWSRAVTRILLLPAVAFRTRATLRRLDNPLLGEAIWMRGSELYRLVRRAIETRFSSPQT